MKTWLLEQQKTIKKWRRRYKGYKISSKIFGFLIKVVNVGIVAWQFYEMHVKDRLEERNNKTTS